MVSRVGNERQQEKTAGRAASLHKGSSLRTQLLDGCGSLQSRCQEEFEGTLVSCKAHSRTLHKEILRYFSEMCGMDWVH